MKAKPRINGELSNGKKKTFHFYISCKLYDSLIQESVERDLNISRVVEDKLTKYDEIKFIILKNRGDEKK